MVRFLTTGPTLMALGRRTARYWPYLVCTRLTRLISSRRASRYSRLGIRIWVLARLFRYRLLRLANVSVRPVRKVCVRLRRTFSAIRALRTRMMRTFALETLLKCRNTRLCIRLSWTLRRLICFVLVFALRLVVRLSWLAFLVRLTLYVILLVPFVILSSRLVKDMSLRILAFLILT